MKTDFNINIFDGKIGLHFKNKITLYDWMLRLFSDEVGDGEEEEEKTFYSLNRIFITIDVCV